MDHFLDVVGGSIVCRRSSVEQSGHFLYEQSNVIAEYKNNKGHIYWMILLGTVGIFQEDAAQQK